MAGMRKTHSRRRSRTSERKVTRIVGLVRVAIARDGVGVGAWVLLALVGIGAAGLAAAVQAGAAPPSRIADAPTLERALAKVERERSALPADAEPDLRRAYLEGLRAGPLNAAAIEALRRSYALEPLGPDASSWRLRFVFEHWPDLPTDLRDRARAELTAAFPRHGWAMRELPESVASPQGRMVAVLMFEQLRLAEASPSGTPPPVQ